MTLALGWLGAQREPPDRNTTKSIYLVLGVSRKSTRDDSFASYATHATSHEHRCQGQGVGDEAKPNQLGHYGIEKKILFADD